MLDLSDILLEDTGPQGIKCTLGYSTKLTDYLVETLVKPTANRWEILYLYFALRIISITRVHIGWNAVTRVHRSLGGDQPVKLHLIAPLY